MPSRRRAKTSKIQKLEDQIRELEDEKQELIRTARSLMGRLNLDPMTRLSNRAAYIVARAPAEKNIEREFVYIDMDNFKRVNDFAGHDEGDKVLLESASILVAAAKEEGSSQRNCFRAGHGDELVAIVPKGKGRQIKTKMIKRFGIRDYGGVKVRPSVGIGRSHRAAELAMQRQKLRHGASSGR